MLGLPDPEMRRFLIAGSEDGIRSALSVHRSHGLALSFPDEQTFSISVIGDDGEGDVVSGPIKQQLKLTVRSANKLMGGET